MSASETGNNPNINPADNESLAGVMRFAFNQLLRNTDGMLPAQVISYDRAENRVQVQLMIAMVSTSGAQVSRSQIASIPVINLGGGGYVLNFPLQPGDLGFVMANDRDLSLFLQTYIESPPNTQRVKNFADGVFIPSVLSDYDVSGEDGNAVLQNLDGSVKISLSQTDINIVADNTIINSVNVTVNADTDVTVNTNTATVNADSSVTVNANTTDINADTSITLNAPITTVTGEFITQGLARNQAGLSVTGLATSVYSAYFANSIYVVTSGQAGTVFNPGGPGPVVPAPPPP